MAQCSSGPIYKYGPAAAKNAGSLVHSWHIVMAYIVMVYTFMAYIVLVCIVTAHIDMAYIVMVYTSMALYI